MEPPAPSARLMPRLIALASRRSQANASLPYQRDYARGRRRNCPFVLRWPDSGTLHTHAKGCARFAPAITADVRVRADPFRLRHPLHERHHSDRHTARAHGSLYRRGPDGTQQHPARVASDRAGRGRARSPGTVTRTSRASWMRSRAPLSSRLRRKPGS